MSNSIKSDWLERLRTATDESVANYFAGGMSSHCPVIPDNIRVWRNFRDLAPDKIRSHQRFVLKVVLRGRNTTILDGCRFRLEPGDGLLIHPFQFHGNAELETPEDLYELMVITFLERFDNGRSLDRLRNKPFHLGDEEFAMLEKVALCHRRRGVVADTEGAGVLGLLLARLAAAAGDAPEPIGGRLDEAAAYLQKHFADSISLKEVAERFGTSSVSLRRMFREHFGGMTPGKLVTSLRMQRAAELLCRSETRVAEVGRLCGFEDPFVFSRAFKRYSGCAPSEYRRRNRTEI